MKEFDVDTVVIGSGVGGLTAALALARSGHSVVVLEQHYVPGGWCHSFDLGGYRFSPGVHYIGELGPGGRMRRVWEGLGLGADLPEFLELNPDGYDHVLVGSQRFDIPKGKERLIERLVARFPDEAAGIRRYFDIATRISRQLDDLLEIRSWTQIARLPFVAPTVVRWGFSNLRSLLDGCGRDPLLKTILSVQCGDHGLPPSLAPACLHASVAAHYFEGGWYPRGGGFAIPRAYVRALRRLGAEVRTRAPVARILVEKGRAAGVRLAGGEVIRARHVVSNADPHVTFGRLVGAEHLGWRLKRRLARTRYSISALSLFMAADMDMAAAGLDSGNYWYSDQPDIEGIYRTMMSPRATEVGRIPGLFLTVTTLKDRTKLRHGHHTMEAFWFVPYSSFRAWAASRYGERPEGYARLKADLKSRMIDAAGRIVPGLADRLVFSDLGTPLTNEHYLAATQGNIYGTEKSVWQIGPWGWPLDTPIAGLTMCGASTVSHGVLGATLSGLLAAARILGCGIDQLLAAGGPSLTTLPADDVRSWPARLARRAGAPALAGV